MGCAEDFSLRRVKTYIAVSDIIRAAEREHDRLRDSRGELVVVEKTRVEDSNGRDSIIVLHLIRFSAATAVASSHDARSIDIQAIGTRNSPFDGFGHPFDSRRATIPTGSSGRDGNEAVRRNLSKEVLRRRAIIAAGAVAPDEDGHRAVWRRGRCIDGVPRKSLVRCERHWTVWPGTESA